MFTKIYDKFKKFMAHNYKFVIFLIFLNLFYFVELPYVIYAPGGSIDLADRIEVEGTYETKGKLQMAYVSMVRGSTPFVLLSYLLPNWDLVKKSDIVYDNESMDDMINRDKVYLQQSIDNAIIEAYRMTDNKLEIRKRNNHIIYIAKEAKTDVKVGDVLLKANGVDVENLDHYISLVQSLKAGDKVNLVVLRDKKEKNLTIEVYDTDDGLKTGISIVTTYEYETDPKIEIESKNSESGPSGGLMLSLGIYNALTKEDITKGRNIIGTGTIAEGGVVGEIGGVKYKLIGAVKNKADVFICPKENYEEAIKVKNENDYDIKVIGVATLEDAIKQLSE